MSDTAYRFSFVIGLAVIAAVAWGLNYKTTQNTHKMLCDAHIGAACKKIGK